MSEGDLGVVKLESYSRQANGENLGYTRRGNDGALKGECRLQIRGFGHGRI